MCTLPLLECRHQQRFRAVQHQRLRVRPDDEQHQLRPQPRRHRVRAADRGGGDYAGPGEVISSFKSYFYI